VDDICAAGWQAFEGVRTEVVCFSDAHISGYGWVGGEPLAQSSTRFKRLFEPKDMFFLEAIAAKNCIARMVATQRRMYLAIDNKALVYAIGKGITSCPRTALVLQQMDELLSRYEASVTPIWIPTRENPADELSRSRPLDPHKLARAMELLRSTRDIPSRRGPELGWVVG
jgi:hypothetical protein